jgi:hypothetical protein
VPIGLALSSGAGSPAAAGHHHGSSKLAQGAAQHQVLTALSTTTDSGSFTFTYSLSANGATDNGGSADSETPVAGMGTINTDPTAMAAYAAVGGTPGQGLDVSVRVDGTNYWEVGSADYQPAPAADDSAGPGSPLPGFAGLVESTLGQRDGAVAMLGMASPSGYLDLTLPSIAGATESGTGTVDGVPVTEYDVTVDPAQLATSAGTTSAEASAIHDALGVLNSQGYRGTTVRVGVDASGFIRQATSTATFSDGGTVVLTATFSDFGCAGTVLMPGQTGSAGPPAGCVSPDTGLAPPTTTTSTTVTTSTAPAPENQTVSPTTPTTVAPPSTPATTSTTLATGTTTSSPSTTTTTTTTTGP